MANVKVVPSETARVFKIRKARIAGEKAGEFVNTGYHMTSAFSAGFAAKATAPLTESEALAVAAQ